MGSFGCRNIIVVGAGVIGLSAAYELSKQGYKVFIISKHVPDEEPYSYEYTSAWAGAHFRPFPSHSDQDIVEMKLTRKTYQHFKVISKEFPEASIKFVKGIDYLEEPSLEYVSGKNVGYNASNIPDFKNLSAEEIPFDNLKFGAEYKTWVLNAPHFVKFLFNRLKNFYGVEFVKMDAISIKQVFEAASSCFGDATEILGVVNCTGRGLRYLGGYDPDVYAIRGQTLLVTRPTCSFAQTNPFYNKTVTIQQKDGSWIFVIERPIDGGFIIGGTKQVNDLCPFPRESDTKGLIERAKPYFSELLHEDGEFNILKVNVGFRPARKGGFKLTKVLIKEQGNKFLIDAYGAGGMGYELSFGAAEKIVKMVNDKFAYISAKL
ncbi:FAD-dependent oxidoreductase [Ascoidea rubescens DSM 1968]|uniref:Nucleotide-binding domain-containing protein n=1 Tax=Ascoidea rubescens DSM 1968 TaxID=1344418 RepID=A0A1D2VFC8_9ASCO|nr:nucleotide-binding domain-containing protein [Ascoidea rubescens DSM 1968]ODV60177.1 nucleotide-binding domain-containing protein [Ascoidea rubescens DSM 1968]